MKNPVAKPLLTVFCCLALASLIGCGSSAKTKVVKVETLPSEALVIVDGASTNTTPTKITLPLDGKDHYLFIKKEGCDEVRKVLTHDQIPDELLLRLNCQ